MEVFFITSATNGRRKYFCERQQQTEGRNFIGPPADHPGVSSVCPGPLGGLRDVTCRIFFCLSGILFWTILPKQRTNKGVEGRRLQEKEGSSGLFETESEQRLSRLLLNFSDVFRNFSADPKRERAAALLL